MPLPAFYMLYKKLQIAKAIKSLETAGIPYDIHQMIQAYIEVQAELHRSQLLTKKSEQ